MKHPFDRSQLLPAVVLTVLCVLSTCGLSAVEAGAAVRYASPGGFGQPPCREVSPCSLFVAASNTIPAGERAKEGDEVIVLPGEYSGEEDLGPEELVSVPLGVRVRGESGSKRPVIAADSPGTVMVLNGESTISDLEIVAVEGWSALFMLDSTADRVVVKTASEEGIACDLGFRAVLRDSVCISTGARGVGVGEKVGTNSYPMNTRTLRNVTAIGAGSEATGILFDISGGEVFVDVKSSIAQGTATDVEAIGRKPGGGSIISLEASDFATAKAVEVNEGVASVTDSGKNGNITTPPLLAGDHFHELAGSATIDQGLLDQWSGSFDIDGNARTVGERADIGADEMLRPTTTTVACVPAVLKVGQETTCTTMIETADSSEPAGMVSVALESASGRGELGTCDAASVEPSRSSCDFRFPVSTVGQDLQLIATYSGDSGHSPSQGTSTLTVTPEQTTTTVSCEPTGIIVGERTICSATVANTDASSVPPTGVVHFDSVVGNGSSLASCALAQVNPEKGNCHISYTPTAVEGGIQEIKAAYLGDEGHEASTSSVFSLTVLPPAAAPPPVAPDNGRAIPPGTRLKHRPTRHTTRRNAIFTFVSTQPDASFQCKLDSGPYHFCRSPFKARVTPGRHVFRVRAIVSGDLDPTPATFRWTVLA